MMAIRYGVHVTVILLVVGLVLSLVGCAGGPSPISVPPAGVDYILFASDRSGNFDIWRIYPNGNWLLQRTDTTGYEEKFPDAYPSGQDVPAAARLVCSRTDNICTMTVGGGSAVDLAGLNTFICEEVCPTWAPDDSIRRRIAYQAVCAACGYIYVASLSWGAPNPPVIAGQTQLATNGCARDPDWCPAYASNRIAYSRLSPPDEGDIYYVEVDGMGNVVGGPTQVTDDPATDRMPSWSPNGDYIAFASDRDGQWQIYKKELPNGPVTQLTWNPKYVNLWPSWSPDGHKIAFQRKIDVTVTGGSIDDWEIWVMDAGNGSGQTQLTHHTTSDDIHPTWVDMGMLPAPPGP